jgi:hypothetical protein
MMAPRAARAIAQMSDLFSHPNELVRALIDEQSEERTFVNIYCAHAGE